MSGRACLLCGFEGPEIKVGLVAWLEPIEHRTFDSIPRCPDSQACRARVEARGDHWEVPDATRPTVQPVPVEEPEPAVASAESWFS